MSSPEDKTLTELLSMITSYIQNIIYIKHNWSKSYCRVGKEGNFEKGFSYHGEDHLPVGHSRVFFFSQGKKISNSC